LKLRAAFAAREVVIDAITDVASAQGIVHDVSVIALRIPTPEEIPHNAVISFPFDFVLFFTWQNEDPEQSSYYVRLETPLGFRHDEDRISVLLRAERPFCRCIVRYQFLPFGGAGRYTFYGRREDQTEGEDIWFFDLKVTTPPGADPQESAVDAQTDNNA
jgi:hypothetical protein